MKALVTGATGFLGSHLVEMAQAAGYEVRALVRNPQKARFLEDCGAEIVLGDLTSPESLVAATRDCDVVFHSAAMVSNWGPWNDFERITVQGTEDLLRAVAANDVKRFVLVSTVRVYDDRWCRKQRVVTEATPTGPRGFRHFGNYARAKVLAEEAAWRWHAKGDVPVTVIRPAWIYGPGDESIIPPLLKFFRSSMASWPSRGNPCADPIYVTDVAACALAAAEAPFAAGQAYNVAPDREIPLRTFLGALCAALGIAAPTRALPYALTASVTRLVEWWARLTRRKTPPAYTRAASRF